MAGLYADIPGTRFALDQDGSVMKYRNYTTSSAWTDVSGSIAEALKVNTANYIDLMTATSATDTNYNQMAVAFPEARDVSGLYIHPGYISGGGATNLTWESSTNTTDGTDGTWSALTVTFSNFGQHDQSGDAAKPYYRNDIATVSLTAVKGIRVRWNGPWNGNTARLYVLHIYGHRPITSVDRLSFWNPSSDQEIGAAFLDFGDIAQGTSVTRQFRIKNLSGSFTANSITVQVSDLLPEYTGTGVEVSTDNTTFTGSVNIGNLASGAISSTLYVRRTVPGAETPTQRNARLLANAASWT